VVRLKRDGDRVGEGDALRLLSRYLWFGGHGSDAAGVAAEAVEVLEACADGRPELAWAYSTISQLRMLSREAEDAIAWGERALVLAERLGVPPAACLVIEDSLPGVRSALAAGMRCVAATTPLTRSAVRAAGVLPPALVVDDPARLASVVLPLLADAGGARATA
jgi:hypothetical protein